MTDRPTPPIALVTGASRGLGFATAAALGARGFHVIALARTVGGLEDLDDAIQAAGGEATLVPLDITDDPGLARMGAAIHGRWGGIDLWVHTAIHAPPQAPADAVAEKDLDRTLAINLRASQRLILMLSPLLRAPRPTKARPTTPTAVHCPDIRAGKAFFGAYGASKAAQTALFTSWAAESTRLGPTVTAFTPAPMATALRARFYPGESPDTLATPAEEATRLLTSIGL